jgi:transcription initiation factor IIF auxiliary subunit
MSGMMNWEAIQDRLKKDGPAKVSVINTSKRSVRHNSDIPQYEWSIYIEQIQPEWLHQEIDAITYKLHPSFKPDRISIPRNMDNPYFRLDGKGWGEFIVEIEIKIKERAVKIHHPLKLSEKENITTTKLKF